MVFIIGTLTGFVWIYAAWLAATQASVAYSGRRNIASFFRLRRCLGQCIRQPILPGLQHNRSCNKPADVPDFIE
jgi:hypothetical protein